ncbi:tetratricopeptide repeat protein [uncultured Tenacibaculum sp.]|uniref:tetratricopeptide repeat protein n=1 Tax=uncultured Tenacibaculum sp. TaxID=174713 RepID=UPI00260615DC|nr:tetratricopeptide repeat protein [uncultured Tenacibaculum sp.]
MRLLIFFIPFLISLSNFSQEKDTTFIKLEKGVVTAKTNTIRINALLEFAEFLYDRDFNASAMKVDEALKLINKNKSNINLQQLAKAYVIKGVVNRRTANFTKALDYYLKAKEIYLKENDILHLSDVYHNMAMLYRHQRSHNKAFEFYKKSIRIKEKLGDIHGIAAGYNMMGVSYRQTKRIDSALICYTKAKDLFSSIRSTEDIQRVNANMVLVYRDLKEYDKALELATQNLIYSKQNQKQHSLCAAYYNISTIYKKKKDYNKSLLYVDSSLIIAKENKFKDLIAKRYLRKSFLYNLLGDYKKAYFDYRIFNRYSDSIFNIENIKKIQVLELSFAFKQEKLADSLTFVQQQKEINLLTENEASKKILYLVLFIITIIGAMFIGILLRNNYKNKEQIIQTKFEKVKVQKALLNEKMLAKEEETKRLVADNTMRLKFKEELLERLKNEVIPIASNKTKQVTNSLISELQMQISTEGKFSELQTKIEEVNVGFDHKLRELYPTLTKSEREMCALLRLNLSIKEIMTIKNTSIDSVKSTRYRIRKKLEISSGDELESFIQKIV